jgi:type VI protein secretion system component VasF
MTSYHEEQLGELLSALPPAPQAWVEAAKELPFARQRLEEIIDRAMADEDYRRRVVAEPERVLEEADVVAHAENVQIIRRRLDPPQADA